MHTGKTERKEAQELNIPLRIFWRKGTREHLGCRPCLRGKWSPRPIPTKRQSWNVCPLTLADLFSWARFYFTSISYSHLDLDMFDPQRNYFILGERRAKNLWRERSVKLMSISLTLLPWQAERKKRTLFHGHWSVPVSRSPSWQEAWG